MKKTLLAITVLLLACTVLCACNDTTEQTAEKVIGTWVSDDYDGPNSEIILTVNENGTCSLLFYEDINHPTWRNGVENVVWDCNGSTFIGNVNSEQYQFELVYDETTDTLTETIGRLKRVYVRDN